MNSRTKIGRVALEKYFYRKPTFIKELNQKWITKVIFPKEPIDLLLCDDSNFTEVLSNKHYFYRIWSIEIGLLPLKLKEGQTLLNGIVKKLNKLQKEDSPSHIIIGESITKDGVIPEVTTTYTIYRLTLEQETLIFNDYLYPAMEMRDRKFENSLKKQEEQFEEDYEKYINSLYQL